LLHDLGTVDGFLHDSLRTYEHMKFEIELAYPFVKPGGLLLADDAAWNAAFSEFAREVRPPAARTIRGVGVLKKRV
jgi:hypothetical protein